MYIWMDPNMWIQSNHRVKVLPCFTWWFENGSFPYCMITIEPGSRILWNQQHSTLSSLGHLEFRQLSLVGNPWPRQPCPLCPWQVPCGAFGSGLCWMHHAGLGAMWGIWTVWVRGKLDLHRQYAAIQGGAPKRYKLVYITPINCSYTYHKP